MSNADEYDPLKPLQGLPSSRAVASAEARVVDAARSAVSGPGLGLGRRSLAEEFALGIGASSAVREAFSSIEALRHHTQPLSALLENSGIAKIAKAQRLHDELFGGQALKNLTRSTAGTADLHSQISALTRPLAGLDVAKWAHMHEATGTAALMRSARWADHIGPRSVAELTRGLEGATRIGGEIEKLTRVAAGISAATNIAQLTATPNLGRLIGRHPMLEATTLKMSLFAGSLDVVGGRGLASQSAFDALLGGWRTRPDLPTDFWRNPTARGRYYRDADVDPGLVDSDNATILEVLIDSGVVEGRTDGKSVSAFIQAGPISVKVTASRPRLGAYRAVSAFEVALRAFVAAKLEAAVIEAGEDPRGWFKRRIPGDVLKRVRERREAAKRDGEAPSPQIAFIDLGDFSTIVTERNNWTVFEPIFGSREAFQVDLTRLNAIRRPTAHPRRIDAVQLAEATLTIARLNEMIRRDGSYDPAWDDDEG